MQQRLPVKSLWVRTMILIVFVLWCGLFVGTLFLSKEPAFFGQSYPLWFYVGIAAVIGAAFSGVTALCCGYRLRTVLAIFFVVPLTVLLMRALGAEPASVTTAWVSVLWSLALLELIRARWPQPLNRRQWRILFIGVLLLTSVVALMQRTQLPVALNPWVVCVGIFLWIFLLRTVPHAPMELHQKNEPSSRRWDPWLIALLCVILWGGWLRLATIDRFGFENDEYYHLNTGMGYAQTGEYIEWNFLTQQPTQPHQEYTRAWPYTWQVAQSIKLFGVSEWSVRLPALVWGLLLLVLFPLVVRAFTRSWAVAFFATLFLAFDDGYIWLSTYTRMYSMFFVLVLASLWAYWKSLTPPDRSEMTMPSRVLWLAFSLALAGAALVIHQSGYLLFVGIAVGALLHFFKEPRVRWYRVLTIGFSFAGIAGLCVHFVLTPFLPPTFFIIRTNPGLSYFDYLTQNMILPWCALAIGAAALVRSALKKIPSWALLVAGTVLPFLLYFVYFAPRYAARKYSLFFIFLFFICVAAGWRWLWQRIPSRAAQIVSVLLFIWFFIELSFPGVPTSILFSTPRADKTIHDLMVQDYRAGYALLEATAYTGDVLVLLAPRTYYLHRTDLLIYEIPTRTDMTIDDLKHIVATHPRGWIIWPKFKNYHLSNELKNYIRKHYIAFEESRDTNMVIYQWDNTAPTR